MALNQEFRQSVLKTQTHNFEGLSFICGHTYEHLMCLDNLFRKMFLSRFNLGKVKKGYGDVRDMYSKKMFLKIYVYDS